MPMARKPATRAEFILFDVVYEDGSQRSNRRVPSELLGGLDGDVPARAVIEEQDRLIAQKSGTPALAVTSLHRSGSKKEETPRSPRAASADVERFGAGRLAGGIERDLLDPRLGRPQKLLAAALEGLAALVDRDRFLERHPALFEPLDDRFKLLDRAFERECLDVA